MPHSYERKTPSYSRSLHVAYGVPSIFGKPESGVCIALFARRSEAFEMADLYNLSAHYWGGSVISLHAFTITGDIFATIPLNFLHSNSVTSWDYILDLANMLVDPVPNCPGIIETGDGGIVDYATAPSAGEFVYRQPGMQSQSDSLFTLPNL